jgi:DNA repair exonuclease SbcCD nuclease subunit
MKLLLVGDPHVTPSNIPEAERLMDLVYNTALKQPNLDGIVFLGDMFHTHLVVRLEVITFWKYWVQKLSQKHNVILLSGNHDQVSDNGREWQMSSLSTLEGCGGQAVISEPYRWNDILFVPHTHDEDKLLKACIKNYDASVLFCHQTFAGSQYENGFYAPNGFDQDKIPNNFKYIVSGHIHKQQQIGRVWYPGTPKWDSISDANEDKGFWIWDSNDNSKVFISTQKVCTPIISLELNEGDEIPELNKDCTNLVVLRGSSQWIAKKTKELKGLAKISAKPTDSISKRIPESKLKTLLSYADVFEWANGIDKQKVLSIIEAVK